MQPQKLILAAFVVAALALLAGCSSMRCSPDELVASNGNQTQRIAPNQDTSKADVLTGAAVADSGGDANLSNQKVGVDVQSPNQATGATFAFAPLFGDVAKALTETLPGEAAVLRRLERLEDGEAAIRQRILDDSALLTAAEKAELESRADRYQAQIDLLIERLDRYAAQKIATAQTIAPDLSSLRAVIYQITTNQTAGNEAPQISDAQAEAIARTAERALEYSPLPGDTSAPAGGE